MKNSNRFIKTVSLVPAMIVLLCSCVVFSQTTEKYVFALPMVTGFEKTKFADMFQQLGGVLSKKLGCKVEVKNLVWKHGVSTPKDIIKKELAAGRVDITYLNGSEYADMLSDGVKGVEPLFILAINKGQVDQACFFTRKGEFSTVSQLRGKKWAGAATILPRFVMNKNGINEPMQKFFGTLKYETDSPIVGLIDMLKTKKVDVVSTYMHTMWLSGELTKKDSFLVPFGCENFESNWIFFARKGMPPNRIAQVRDIMLKAPKDKDFAQFQFAFTMIKGSFAVIDPRVLELNKSTAALIRKNGWEAEQMAFYKKFAK